MAITFRAYATLQAGTTSATPGLPTGTVSGDLQVMYAVTKPYTVTPTAAANWDQIGTWVVGTGEDGEGVGQIRITAWKNETGITGGVTNTGGNAMLAGKMSWYKDVGDDPWQVYASAGSDVDGGTSFVATMADNLNFQIGDHAMTIGTLTDNLTTRSTDGFNVPGMNFPARTAIESGGTANGSNIYEWGSRYQPATTGTQTAPNTVTATVTSGATGGAMTVRISLVGDVGPNEGTSTGAYDFSIVEAVGFSPLSHPTNLTATVNGTVNTTIDLAWTASPDPVAAYDIERDAVIIARVPATQTTYADVGLADGEYDYRVRAVR